MSARYIPKLS